MFGKRVRYVNHPQLDENNLRRHDIVGESFHQDVLTRMQEHERRTDQYVWVALRAEPNNPHDSKAISVEWVLPDGSGTAQVGHIPKSETAQWHPVIKTAPKGTVWTWPAETTGGDGLTVGLQFLY